MLYSIAQKLMLILQVSTLATVQCYGTIHILPSELDVSSHLTENGRP